MNEFAGVVMTIVVAMLVAKILASGWLTNTNDVPDDDSEPKGEQQS